MRVLHVLNYGWPYIDGYTVRSMGLITAQRQHLEGVDPMVAVSPFEPLASATDRDFTLDGWGPDTQIHTVENHESLPRSWERPAVGLSPTTSRAFRDGLAHIIERVRPDLIHAHHPHYVAKTALEVANAHGISTVYEVRCFNGDYDLARSSLYCALRGRMRNFWEYRVFRRADTVVTISTSLADRVRKAGVDENSIFIVRNSVSTDIFTPRSDSREKETEADSDRDKTELRPLHIGYATSFSHIENLDLIIHGARQAREHLARHGRRLQVTLAGRGEEWDRIQQLADTEEVEDIVTQPGFIPFGKMADFYRSLDVFVVPRASSQVTRDTTPLKPLEALACGVPLLATNLPALHELLGENPGTRFFEPSPTDLAAELVRIARDGWELPSSPLTERSWENEVHRYRDVYSTAAQWQYDTAR